MKDADQSRGLGHGHAHFWERALSRNRFIKVVTCATGTVLGADVLPVLARAAGPSDATPKPIPGGFSIGDLNFHVSGGPSAEPSVITDFNGIVGIAFVSGHGTGTNTTTGVSTPLLFDSDMRFMTGEYVAADGHHYQGTFGFVWLDVYVDQVDPFAPDTHQIHEFDPGIHPYPSGLFWTVPLDSSSVRADLGHGMASYHVTDLALRDFGTLANAFFNAPSTPATVSFDLQWQMLTVTNRKQTKVRDVAQGYAGDFWEVASSPQGHEALGAVTLKWSGTASDFRFVSNSAASSESYFAALGHERNGVFFPQGTVVRAHRTTSYARVRAGRSDLRRAPASY